GPALRLYDRRHRHEIARRERCSAGAAPDTALASSSCLPRMNPANGRQTVAWETAACCGRIAPMSNRAYLTCCDHQRIYPAFGDLSFEPQRDVVLACDGCVPLLWLALFAASDLQTHTFTLRGQDVSAVAPLA